MTGGELATYTAATVAVLVALWLFPRALARFETFRPHRRVLVVLKSGETVAGVLLKRRRDLLVIGGATVTEAAGMKPVPADGSLFIDRANVRWVQTPEG